MKKGGDIIKTVIVGIYKITNTITGKSYIGHSKDILRRWAQHRFDAKTKELPLYRAIRKYGIENFDFSILEECKIKDLSVREDYYVNKFNSYIPNGYNYNKPETHHTNILIPDKYLYIKKLLKTTDISMTQIGKEVGLKLEAIRSINNGTTWRQDNENYPLRQTRKNYNQSLIIPLLQKGLTAREIANELNTTLPAIQGYMKENKIYVSKYGRLTTSNKKTLVFNEKKEFLLEFSSIKEAGIFLQEKIGGSLNTALCGIKRNLDKDHLYKGYYWKRKINEDGTVKSQGRIEQ